MCIVETKNGAVKGVREDGVLKWRGIPYARPPLDELRFAAAQPVENWEGVKDASRFGAIAVQNRKRKDMSEDCLTLNIWSKNTGGKRPVLLYLHGGAFMDGSGSDPEYEGTILVNECDVVLVTINYRLGVLGFVDFSFLGEGFDANPGLTDILQALKWTYENIEAFGGDANNITVVGQSAGAYCVSALCVMPSARPYMSKGIMMSGAPTLMHEKKKAHSIGQSFMDYAGIKNGTELKSVAAQELAAKQPGFRRHCGLGSATYCISVDGELLPGYPIPLAAQGKAKIPVLIGTARDEMSFLFIKPFNDRLDMGRVFEAGVDGEGTEDARRIERAYDIYGKRSRHMLMSDLVFRMASVWFGEALSAHADVWMYRFDYATAATALSGLRAFHSTDMMFLFGNYKASFMRAIFLLSPVKTGINRVAREMRSDFAHFAETGQLDWQKCDGAHTPGRCYGGKNRVEQVVPPEIKSAYENSRFRRRSFSGASNNLSEL